MDSSHAQNSFQGARIRVHSGAPFRSWLALPLVHGEHVELAVAFLSCLVGVLGAAVYFLFGRVGDLHQRVHNFRVLNPDQLAAVIRDTVQRNLPGGMH